MKEKKSKIRKSVLWDAQAREEFHEQKEHFERLALRTGKKTLNP